MFDDHLKVTTHLARAQKGRDKYGRLVQSGPVTGIEVHIPCPECGSVTKVEYSIQEAVHLLNGGQVQGVMPAEQGWRAAVTCQNGRCSNMQGRTTIPYNLFYHDLKRYIDNLQAGRRQVPRQQQMPPGHVPPGGGGGGWPFG